MDNIKTDKYYAEKAIEHINAISNYMTAKSYEQFVSDGELIDAVMFRLVQMIENIKNISSDFKEGNSQIPWGDIIGFRNGIVHEYGKTDYVTVYETATKDIYDLKEVLETID
ncbi:MAG: DUF86 domain-containing protein [Bacilli bacterium]|nr:DUF86 domain-containing protein [Bacilli bacterium]